MRNKNSSERILYYTLWFIIILGLALWKFWPEFREKSETIPVTMAEELKVLFRGVSLKRTQPSFYEVELVVEPQYMERIKTKEQKVHIGFDLWGEHSILSSGVAPCAIRPMEKSIVLNLQNPKRISAKKIQLYLAP